MSLPGASAELSFCVPPSVLQARAGALLRALLGGAHAACEAAAFLPFFAAAPQRSAQEPLEPSRLVAGAEAPGEGSCSGGAGAGAGRGYADAAAAVALAADLLEKEHWPRLRGTAA